MIVGGEGTVLRIFSDLRGCLGQKLGVLSGFLTYVRVGGGEEKKTFWYLGRRVSSRDPPPLLVDFGSFPTLYTRAPILCLTLSTPGDRIWFIVLIFLHILFLLTMTFASAVKTCEPSLYTVILFLLFSDMIDGEQKILLSWLHRNVCDKYFTRRDWDKTLYIILFIPTVASSE